MFVDIVAAAILKGREHSDEYAAEHFVETGHPATMMSRIQVMRSRTLAILADVDPAVLKLDPEYAEFGKISARDMATGNRYVLKARSVFGLHPVVEAPLFAPGDDLQVLLYRIQAGYLLLESAPIVIVKTKGRRRRMALLSEPVERGRWPVAGGVEDDVDLFNQGEADDFDELGGEDEDGRAADDES